MITFQALVTLSMDAMSSVKWVGPLRMVCTKAIWMRITTSEIPK